VNWGRDGEEMKAWADPLYGNSGWSRIIKSVDFYFQPGLTWSRRTQLGFNLRNHPAGAVFSDKGPVAFVESGQLQSLLGLMNSAPFRMLLSLQMAFGSFEVGVVQRTPLPKLDPNSVRSLTSETAKAVRSKRSPDHDNELSHTFTSPGFLQVDGKTIVERAAARVAEIERATAALAQSQAVLDTLSYRQYGIDERDQALIETVMQGSVTTAEESEESAQPDLESNEQSEQVKAHGFVRELISYCVGSAFGRWDLRYATRERHPPDLPDPFSPLPVCPPGILQGSDGLPLRRTPAGYPLRIDGDGILIDDLDHSDDLVRRVRNCLEVIWKDRAEAIEKEAYEILGVKELRDYFRKPGKGGFWDDHVSRYSKSRRKAPIYWLLQS
jgi:hypothetical protein